MMLHIARLLALGLSIVIATPAPAQPLTGVLKRIKDSGEITLGYRDASVPFSYLDDKQQPVGYSMDLCLRVVDHVKAELKLPALKVIYNPVTSANCITLIANGTIELECGSTVNNVERQAQVAFSDTTFIVSTLLHRQTRRQSQDAGRPARQDGRLHCGDQHAGARERPQPEAEPRHDDPHGEGSRGVAADG